MTTWQLWLAGLHYFTKWLLVLTNTAVTVLATCHTRAQLKQSFFAYLITNRISGEILFSNMHPSVTISFHFLIHTSFHISFWWFHIHTPAFMTCERYFTLPQQAGDVEDDADDIGNSFVLDFEHKQSWETRYCFQWDNSQARHGQNNYHTRMPSPPHTHRLSLTPAWTYLHLGEW